ncbi:MAG TPA: prolyl aminopeptidase [Gammaproteobacteria bacterium]|nr:prolyl aminopeptidase [Gammaproteobacteria bacterium]
MGALYPEIPVNRSGHIAVSGGHCVHWEESGNPDGLPALFVHGGPGGGTSPAHRRYFDPAAYRIVLFDQRGCGQSRPHASLEHNTTWDLVDDMERIRELLGIERWLLFGGSWGSTLALAYAQAHPRRVRAMVLRGIFMLCPREIRWFYQYGASELFPEAWEDFVAPIPEAERDDLVDAYHRRLTSDNPQVRARAAVAWSMWEARTSKLVPDSGLVTHHGGTRFAEAFARIECHYFVNGGFMPYPEHLLDGAERLRHVPAVIVQGRYDVVCPVRTAWELHRRWPEAELRIVPDAGHSATEPGIAEQLVAATDRFRGD